MASPHSYVFYCVSYEIKCSDLSSTQLDRLNRARGFYRFLSNVESDKASMLNNIVKTIYNLSIMGCEVED